MIGFLAPLYLLAAAAAAVPLLIHLLRRRIGTRVDFPAVRYLVRAEREHSRKLRLRNLLLMLLRVAAVLALALAAARPVLRTGGGGHSPTTLAIVLDNSLSSSAIVGGRPVLDRLKDGASAVARRATAEDRLWLVTADGSVQGGGRGVVLDAIARAEPLGGAGDVDRAVVRAVGLVRQGAAPEREVAVITDAQATSWRVPVGVGDVRVRAFAPALPPPSNRGVTAAAAVPPRWTPRGAVRGRVLTPDSATYRITLEGRTLARGTAIRDEEITVRAAPPERGWTAGAVELEPDEMRGDDVRHFALWLGPPPSVNVHPTAGAFVQSAVDALVQSERVAAGSGIAVAPADEAARRPALLLAPSDPVRLGAANRALERLGVPWRFGAARRGESAVRAGGGVPGGAPRALDGVTVALRYPLAARGAEPAETLATVSGEPWIVRGRGYVLVASPLVPEATTLPVRAAFVPWLDDVLAQQLSAGVGTIVTAAPGAMLPRPAGAENLEIGAGSTLPLSGDSLQAPPRAGVYFFTAAGRRVGALVVNPEPDESVLDRLDAAALAARLRGRDVRATADGATFASWVFASAPRRAAAFPLLVVAAAVLLAESALAGTGRKRPS